MADETMTLAHRREELPTHLTPPPLAGGLDILTLGRVLAQSGYFKDALQEAQAVVKILRGQELGIGPATAMSEIHIVEGKPTLSASLMASLIKRSGRYDYRVRRADDEACELEFFERGESLGTVGFSMKDAARAGLATKMNWQKYAADMCFARAMSRGAKRFCADVFGGAVYLPDEIEVEPPQRFGPSPRSNVAHRALQTAQSAPSYAAATIEPVSEETRRAQAVDAMRAKLTEVIELNLWDAEGFDVARWADYDLSGSSTEELIDDAEALEVVLAIARRAESHEEGSANGQTCTVCGKVLTSGQYQVSFKTFGHGLCPQHQREAKAAG